jgi:hypothetical protein
MKLYRTSGGIIYKFGPHALRRMAQRGIRQEDIEHALDSHDVYHKDRKGNDCFIKQLGDGRRIRIVVAKDNTPMEIITVIILD